MWADGAEIEITVEDARRCNRLRGLSVRNCACRLPTDSWQQCPPAAIGILDATVVRDVGIMLGVQPLKSNRTIVLKTEALTGELCREPGCGGFMIRTGSCMTCQSCGFNEGCG